MTERVTLRPASEEDLAVLLKLTQDPETSGEFTWAGWSDLRYWRRRWDENGLIGPDGGVLMVVRDDEPVGIVSWRPRQTGAVSRCWEMGIGLVPQARGQGYGTEAHRLVVRYLFAHTTVHRIEAVTEAGNIAEQKALENAGLAREVSSAAACGATAHGGTRCFTAFFAPTRSYDVPAAISDHSGIRFQPVERVTAENDAE